MCSLNISGNFAGDFVPLLVTDVSAFTLFPAMGEIVFDFKSPITTIFMWPTFFG